MNLQIVAAASGIYDTLLGVALLTARPWLGQAFGVSEPQPPIHADLNGLFTLAIGVGYVLPFRDPERYRGYLWIMGPVLKGVGAAWFVADVCWRGSPSSYLLFAVADGTLALLTLWGLLGARSGAAHGRTTQDPTP